MLAFEGVIGCTCGPACRGEVEDGTYLRVEGTVL